jgi:hypothetical protein
VLGMPDGTKGVTCSAQGYCSGSPHYTDIKACNETAPCKVSLVIKVDGSDWVFQQFSIVSQGETSPPRQSKAYPIFTFETQRFKDYELYPYIATKDSRSTHARVCTRNCFRICDMHLRVFVMVVFVLYLCLCMCVV